MNVYLCFIGSDDDINEWLKVYYKNNEVNVSNGYLNFSFEVISGFFELVV